MKPYWYFTTLALEEYMKIAVRKKWDTSEVSTKLEAFAIAGCEVVSELQMIKSYSTAASDLILDLMRTSKQKSDHMKREIREKISEMLGASLTFKFLFLIR